MVSLEELWDGMPLGLYNDRHRKYVEDVHRGVRAAAARERERHVVGPPVGSVEQLIDAFCWKLGIICVIILLLGVIDITFRISG